MNRFRFRAWDNVKNRMLYVGEDLNIVVEPTDIGFKAIDIDYEQGEPDYYLDHLIYMQYANLKDKNGISIYDKDLAVVHEFDEHGESQYVSVVEFLESSFLVTDPDDTQIPLDCFHDTKTWGFTVFELEVIGNVYENPKLLKEVNNGEFRIKRKF